MSRIIKEVLADTLREIPYEDHCDNVIGRLGAPNCLRWYLLINRLPASDKSLCGENGVEDPKLFAKYQGQWIRVVMSSRMGDLGITNDLDREYGYDRRVLYTKLTDFTDERPTAEPATKSEPAPPEPKCSGALRWNGKRPGTYHCKECLFSSPGMQYAPHEKKEFEDLL